MNGYNAFVTIIIVFAQPCLNETVRMQVHVSSLWRLPEPANKRHNVRNKNTIDLKLMAEKVLNLTRPEEHPAAINELHKYMSTAM